jgi:hypothetical protein
MFDDIKVLGVLFGSISFFSFFVQDALNKDFHHGEAFSSLRDVQLISFDLTFMHIFGRILDLNSLDCP